MEHLNDKELIVLFFENQNKEAIAVLYKRYATLVFGLCFIYLKDEDQAKDAVTDIFIRVMEKLDDNVEQFDRWLYIVSKNEIFNLLRKKNVKIEEINQNSEVRFMENEQYERHYIEDINKEQIVHALNSLNDSQKICIDQFYLQKKSYQEIVLHTGYDIKKVKSCIQNGKRNLKLFFNQKNDSHDE